MAGGPDPGVGYQQDAVAVEPLRQRPEAIEGAGAELDMG
jgi:hypothetical protein